MVKTVKLDRRDNYFLDSSTGEKIEKYDPSNKNTLLILKLENSILNVDSSKIQQRFGNIVVQHNEDRYIIDDGYQNNLIRAGYIVYKDYDKHQEPDKRIGGNLRNSILCNSFDTMMDLIGTDKYIDSTPYAEIVFADENFRYIIDFSTINNIVAKNQRRKENALPFFPFDKDMDKYGTIYLTVYAQKLRKLNQEEGNAKFIVADDFIFKMIKAMGTDYKYSPMAILKRLIYWNP